MQYHRQATGWREATVVKNAAASANSNARRLVRVPSPRPPPPPRALGPRGGRSPSPAGPLGVAAPGPRRPSLGPDGPAGATSSQVKSRQQSPDRRRPPPAPHSLSAAAPARPQVLSVADSVKHLSGRKFGKTPSQERLEEPRWYDRFTTPGQCVALRQPGEAAGMPMALSSSPCQVRQESAFIDASLIEILVDPSMQVPSAPDASSALSSQAARLCALGPGDVLECSLPMGRGIASILSTDDLEFAIAEVVHAAAAGKGEERD